MTEKRFVLQDLDILCRVLDNGKPINGIETVHLLNKFYEENEQLKEDVERCRNNFSVLDEVKCEIAEENEQLKTIRSDLICELDIVQNELNIAIDKGFAPTTPYKNYMASKKTEYDKFWENKIKTHNNRLNGVRE